MRMMVNTETWPLKAPLRVAGHSLCEAEVVVVRLTDGAAVGAGEGAPVWYKGETAAAMAAAAEAARGPLEAGLSRRELLNLLPASSARCAIDAALWSLEANRRGVGVRELLGYPPSSGVTTAFTVGIGDPLEMAAAAQAWRHATLLKVKLGGGGDDVARLRAVRAARPDVRLTVDVNTGWSVGELLAHGSVLVDLDVELVEQPLAPEEDAVLEDLGYPVPLAADESVQDISDLERIRARYQVVNIKLDKCGGLTRALEMKARARALGLDPVIGNMVGTALSIGPHILAAEDCPWADLDGPAFLACDRQPPLRYSKGRVWSTDPAWR